MTSRTNSLLIQTPEGIFFPLLLAGPVTRFLAWLVDIICIAMLMMVAGILLGSLRILNWDIAGAFTIIAYFVISIGYPIFTEWRWRGQTLGKRLLHLRVMDAQGLHLQLSQIVIRNLLRFVDFLPGFYTVGGLFSLFTARAQRLGDLAANTIVVRNPQIFEPDLAQIFGGKYNSLRDFPHLAARLRQRTSPGEAGITLQAVLRREELDPVARLELFGEIVSHFKKIVEFPPEATEDLTDEQYVRNVVDILFRKETTN